jgi:hypothetical protein
MPVRFTPGEIGILQVGLGCKLGFNPVGPAGQANKRKKENLASRATLLQLLIAERLPYWR